jgi:regulator of sirC expression with transglutaminase-like and TPR domain
VRFLFAVISLALSPLLAAATLLFAVTLAHAAQTAGQFSDPTLEAKLETLFTPGRDLADIKFVVDAMNDPAADIAVALTSLNQMTITLRHMAAPPKTGAEKLAVLKRFVYEAGPWNDQRPFAYDMQDPLGKRPENRYLHNYLSSRRGNCITMPILFMILGQRIGLDLTLAEAPLHLLVKYTDDQGKVWNLEATSGAGFTRDSHYRKELPMTDKALAEGTYLRALSREETVAMIVSDIAVHDLHEGRYEHAVIAANALQRHFPRSAYLTVIRGSAYAKILSRDILAKYKRESEMTPDIRAYADVLYNENQSAFAEAEALGWTEKDGLK